VDIHVHIKPFRISAAFSNKGLTSSYSKRTFALPAVEAKVSRREIKVKSYMNRHVHRYVHAVVGVLVWSERGYMKKKKSERLVVQMDADFKRQLDNRSKLTGMPISEFVRRALAEALKRKP